MYPQQHLQTTRVLALQASPSSVESRLVPQLLLLLSLAFSMPLYAHTDSPSLYQPADSSSVTDTTVIDSHPNHRQYSSLSSLYNDPDSTAPDQNLAFNHLWMRQYQDDYKSRSGGSALGKLFRLGLKSAYRTYSGRNSSQYSSSKDSISSNYSDLDYRLRLSGSKVKLNIKYEF